MAIANWTGFEPYYANLSRKQHNFGGGGGTNDRHDVSPLIIYNA